MNIPSTIITLIAGIALTLISLWYGQNHGLMPVAASADASQVDDVFNFMMTIATGLFLLIEGVLVICILRFRRKKDDQTDGPSIEGNVPLEIVWTAIPTVVVFILAIYSFEIYNNMGGLDPMASGSGMMAHHHHKATGEMVAMGSNGQTEVAIGIGQSTSNPSGSSPLVVDVSGMQYAWIFTYPDTGIVAGDLHVPVDRPVQLNIKATDVIHAFWLPELRIKQDATPGQSAQLGFLPNRIGQYPIICAELCGAYHGAMKTTMTVESAEDYEKWVQEHTLAQGEIDKNSVAINPQDLSDGQFLEPYVKAMGMDKQLLNHVHPMPMSTLPVSQ